MQKQKTASNIKRTDKQSGAVLVMALVMLAVLTLIGVASMSSSSAQLKIAANTQQYEVAFQAAQAVISFFISEDASNPIDYQDISGTTQFAQYPIDYDGTNFVSGEMTTFGASGLAAVSYVGCTAGIGGSLEEGKGQKFNFYNVQVLGSNPNGTSASVQVQGVRYPAAGC